MWPVIICPEHGEPLALGVAAPACPRGHRYRGDAGIVRLVERAPTYTDTFALEWRIYRRTQLDSHTGTTISLDRARRCAGEPCWEMLGAAPRVDLLEVGCGAGRFTEVLLAAGAHVTSADLSSAVEVNQENFPQGDRHRILQADLMHLPFAPGQYDVVFCLGVIQHTPAPERAIEKLYRQVKPGGWLVIDHYARDLSQFTKIAPLLRLVMRRLPPERAMRWTERLVAFFLPLHRAARHSRVAQALLSRVSPLLTYYHALPLNDDLQREWALLDTYDSLTDWHKHYRTEEQIRRVLEGLGGIDVRCRYGGNGVEAHCRRPSTP